MAGRFGIRSLRRKFPSENACLEFLLKRRHGKRCSCGGEFRRIPGRKQYQCSRCRFQIAPTAGTIFEKSKVPLSLWFHVMLVFSNAKCGISAKVIERDLEITYKCAWRMLTLIRGALTQSDDALSGDVEVDTGYIGGYAPLARRMHNKATVFAAIQRGGTMRAEVTKDATAKAHKNFVWKNVSTKNTRLMTDKANRFDRIALPYERHAVNHHKGEYVRGDVHVRHGQGAVLRFTRYRIAASKRLKKRSFSSIAKVYRDERERLRRKGWTLCYVGIRPEKAGS
ncbi:MAG: ISSpo3, transposase [Candidatus Kaiserbacteria bacterium GW2011_GWA2_58_9]|uniref:ISSpo3, transposase n=1 Tax=Candidatus Kaiserbacteria bacterium GW2011_GWA2_58_9 TaxID=1618672 RepID=A0A0G2BJE7_9BACT|nr:MAG: ISSpo3, transposase [Candidatus Kaiserbacteria bacterium GW2011_GWA2_58_9]